MNETTPFITSVLDSFQGGFVTFLSMVDWTFMVSMMLVVFLSNMVLPSAPELPKALRWMTMHRYRVPAIALVLSVVFLALRDYGSYSRGVAFTYFLTMVFGMCFNLWFLDQPSSWVSGKWPWLRVLLRGRDGK